MLLKLLDLSLLICEEGTTFHFVDGCACELSCEQKVLGTESCLSLNKIASKISGERQMDMCVHVGSCRKSGSKRHSYIASLSFLLSDLGVVKFSTS